MSSIEERIAKAQGSRYGGAGYQATTGQSVEQRIANAQATRTPSTSRPTTPEQVANIAAAEKSAQQRGLVEQAVSPSTRAQQRAEAAAGVAERIMPDTTLQRQRTQSVFENSAPVKAQREQAAAERRTRRQTELAVPLLVNNPFQKKSTEETLKNYGPVSQRDDFDDYAEAGRQLYERQQIRKQNQFRESGQSTEAAETKSVDQIRFDAMTNDERRVYFYRLAKDGQDAADRYMQSLNNQINARIGFQEAEEIENMPSGVGKALRYGAQSILGGMDQASKGIAQFVNGKAYDPSPTAITSQQIGSNLEGAKKYLYQAGTSIGNMLPSIAVSMLSGGLGAPAAVTNVASGLTTALGSGGNAYGEAKQQGYSELQARTYGVLMGASEAALEKVLGGISELRGGASVADKLLEKVSGIENGLTRWALTGAVNIGSEINEEEVQNFLEPLFRTVIFGEAYEAPTIQELVDTAITTAISTGIMELGQTTPYSGAEKPRYDAGATPLDRAMMDTLAGRETPENVTQRAQETELDRIMLDTMANGKSGISSDVATNYPKNVKNLLNATKEQITRFIQNAFNKQNQYQFLKISDVTPELAETLRDAGIEVDGYAHALRDNDIRHVDSSHGSQSTDKYKVTADVLGNVQDVIDNYDNLYRGYDTKAGNPTIVYEKKMGNRTFYVEEVLEDGFLGTKQMLITGENSNPSFLKKMKEITSVLPETDVPARSGSTGQSPPGKHVPDAESNASYNSNIADTSNFVNTQNSPNAESSVGAAQYGFDPYTNAANQYGTIREGEKPSRVVDVPVSMDGETKVSLYARTAAEAKTTTDEMVSRIEKLVTDGKLSHEVYSNKQAVADGAKQIVDQYARGKTIEQIRSEFVRDANAGKAGAKLVARGTTLYADAIAAKDYQAASDILVALTAVETNAGQSVQAARLLKSLTPEGRIFTVQRMVSNLEAQINKGRSKQVELNVPDTLLNAYQNAETETAQRAALDDIYQNVADQVPTTLREGLQQWRYFSMLVNPSTHAKNIMGNISGAIAKIGKDNLAALGETIFIGDREGRTKAFLNLLNKTDQNLLNMAWADYDTAADLYEDSVGKYSASAGEINDRRRYWKINDPQNALTRGMDKFLAGAEKISDFNTKALEVEDVWFSKPMYTAALAGYMKANHMTEITDAARTYAMSEAKRGTYNDMNAVSKWASQIGNDSKIGRFLAGTIYPFKKVPANVMVRTVEYSPLGYIKGMYDLIQMQRGNTDITTAKIIDDFAAATTGTALLGLGVLLAKQGILRATGTGDDKEKEQQKNAFGAKDFSILVGDTYIPIDSLTLTGTGLLTGAQIWEAAQNARNGDEPISFNDVLDALSKITDPVFEQSMLSGLDSILSTIQNSGNKDINYGELGAKMGVQILGNYIGQYVPTLVGRVASSMDENQRSTYIEPDGAWGPVQSAVQGLQKKVPVWRENMAITRGNWGVPVSGNGADGTLAAIGKAVTPVYPSKAKTDPVEQEIARLHSVNSDYSNFYTRPKKGISVDGTDVKLTSGQYDRYTETRGQTDYNIRKTMLDSEVYKSVPDSVKSKAMELSQQYANEKGKEAAGVGYTASDKWVTDLAGKSDDEIAKAILGKAIDAVGGLSDGAPAEMFTSEKYTKLPEAVSGKAQEIADEYAEAMAKKALGYEVTTKWIQEAEALDSDAARADYFTLKAREDTSASLANPENVANMQKRLASPVYTGVSKEIMEMADEIAENFYESLARGEYGADVDKWILDAKSYSEKSLADLFVEKAVEKAAGKLDGGKYDSMNTLYDSGKIDDAAIIAVFPQETMDKWVEYGKPKGVTAGDVLDLLQFKNSDEAKTETDENGKKIKGKSTQDKVIAFIDGQNLTDKEKDAWFCCLYAAKNSPWKWAR
uniref:Nuclease n=1 Tax=Myoviridae sp. ctxZR60 TaxID=2826712 RepID=A0A8S5MUY6_9CAUD|nr:MAG TPA: nuclease [Myoviridae sp. ctxZR60]